MSTSYNPIVQWLRSTIFLFDLDIVKKTYEESYRLLPIDVQDNIKENYLHDIWHSKYIRKAAWRLMVRVMSREAARFVQSCLGELKISEARYEDLLGEVDQRYSTYLNILFTTIKHA
jgi:hypothetical protein